MANDYADWPLERLQSENDRLHAEQDQIRAQRQELAPFLQAAQQADEQARIDAERPADTDEDGEE